MNIEDFHKIIKNALNKGPSAYDFINKKNINCGEKNQFCEDLAALLNQIKEAYECTKKLSEGDLDINCSKTNFFAMPAKNLQSNLNHLTWQAQQISDGDYNHKVSFLGDFSEAFNKMTESLKEKDALEKRLIEVLEEKATTDSLTKIANRSKFNEILTHEMERADRYQNGLSLIMLDIDHFKKINDTYGHIKGDETLKRLAEIVENNIRKSDFFARWGGEEFILLVPHTSLDNAAMLAEKLRKLVKTSKQPVDCQVTCSFGVTHFKKGDTANTFTDRADKALYKAKENGRDRVEITK
ncbi:GGDEF domain-containing protein [Flexistipes sp.]|uniref:GGDEF domain-containing protein n=1 Tax=Flexistipes sp. TaxID=3088135 RepID=UPI002E1C58DB|nr:GGDEF domain-containing protein [Flexistipes sp.]